MVKIICENRACVNNTAKNGKDDNMNCTFSGKIKLNYVNEEDCGVDGKCGGCGDDLPEMEGLQCSEFKFKDYSGFKYMA